MKRIHYLSGILLTVFIALHLCNHLMALRGASVHIRTMEYLRVVYRNPVAEVLLLIAIFVQVVSGLSLVFRSWKKKKTAFEKLHLYSGLYLALFLIIHLVAVFSGRYALHLDTNFYFGVAGLNSFPTNLFFIPYYGLAIFSVFAHLASVHRQKATSSIGNFSPLWQAQMLVWLGVFMTVVIFYALTDGFRGVVIPAEYKILTGQ